VDEPALVENRITLAGRELVLRRPPDPEALLSEEAFEREEFLPYWAELWPSGLALAEEVAGRELHGRRVLELGCGLGLPSLAAALAGADVLATDWSPDAVALLRRNAARNGISLAVEDVSWFDPGPLAARAPWDLVLAADVLYERRNVSPLLALLPRLGPEILVAEPGRPAAAEFLERAARGWTVETSVLRESPAVRLYRLT
jgi:predicted nicotinamide N-methyase